MARYTSLFSVKSSRKDICSLLTEILESCDFKIIYHTNNGDYMMAREVPGAVAFAKLVTIEILIDKPTEQSQDVKTNFVVKNEELPLHADNHCQRKFQLLTDALLGSGQFQKLAG